MPLFLNLTIIKNKLTLIYQLMRLKLEGSLSLFFRSPNFVTYFVSVLLNHICFLSNMSNMIMLCLMLRYVGLKETFVSSSCFRYADLYIMRLITSK